MENIYEYLWDEIWLTYGFINIYTPLRSPLGLHPHIVSALAPEVTMWLTGFQTFGVIEGMAVGTAVASVFFVYQFAKVPLGAFLFAEDVGENGENRN